MSMVTLRKCKSVNNKHVVDRNVFCFDILSAELRKIIVLIQLVRVWAYEMAESESPVVKKARKPTKTVDQKYKAEYSRKWPVLTKSTVSDCHVRCQLCQTDFSVAHGGAADCCKHLRSSKHSSLEESRTSAGASNMLQYFTTEKDNSVIRAEVLFTQFLLEHNIPVAAADHSSKLFRAMFPDSKIAGQYACGRTKTTAIIETLADNTDDVISQYLHSGPFSLATDASTDMDSIKLYPLVVRYLHPQQGRIMCVLLTLKECSKASTGENIFKLLDAELQKRKIPWSNCICFAADNANVMQGLGKGVAGYIGRQNPGIYFLGCPCHLMHIAAERAAKELPIDLHDVLTKIWYYLDKSSNRHQDLRRFQQLCDVSVHKILKHVSTRWLSLGVCLDRLIEQWEPLRNYFEGEYQKKKVSSKPCAAVSVAADASRTSGTSAEKVQRKPSKADQLTKTAEAFKAKPESFNLAQYMFSQGHLQEKAADKRKNETKAKEDVRNDEDERKQCRASPAFNNVKIVREFLVSRNNYLYCLFLKAAIPVFEKANLLLQKDAPQIHLLHRILTEQIMDIFTKFLKPTAVVDEDFKPYSVHRISYKDKSQQKSDLNLFIGAEAQAYIARNGSKLRLSEFYSSVRNYYIAACSYMLSKFPYQDQVLINAAVADISTRVKQEFSSIRYFIDRYPCLLPGVENDPRLMDCLESEFSRYQVTLFENTADSIDKAWFDIGLMRDANGCLMFEKLSSVMLGILVLFHSNADCERIFSIVRKNKTEFRPNLGSKVLGSIVCQKVSMAANGNTCYQEMPSNQLLVKAKKATAAKLASS